GVAPGAGLELAAGLRRWVKYLDLMLVGPEDARGSRLPRRAAVRDTDRAMKKWVTVSEAASVVGTDRGAISHLVKNGTLKSNGKKRHQRRIDSASLVQYQLERQRRSEKPESDKAVEGKQNRAQQRRN